MIHCNPDHQGNTHPSASAPKVPLTDYQMAVLSTLFDEEDSGKVLDLARQWGYQQEALYSVWNEMHAHCFEETAIIPNK